MSACIITRGVKPENLASFDLEYLFLRIRAASVGEEIVLNVRCLDDNETEVSHTVNINTIQVFKPEGHSDKIMLSDKVGVIMKYLVSLSLLELGLLLIQMQILWILLLSLDQIFEGEEITEASDCTKKELLSFIESMTQEQFQKLTEFFETMPRLQHSFEVKNPNTGRHLIILSRVYRVFRIALFHTSLEEYYQTNFALMQHHKYSLTENR